ncbi:hypothetical protein JCM5353_002222 [Sporobolomyces roseus]
MISSLLSRLHLTPDSSSSSASPLSDSPTQDTSKDSHTVKESDTQMHQLFENDYGEAEIPSSEQIIEELENHGGLQKAEGGSTSTGFKEEDLGIKNVRYRAEDKGKRTKEDKEGESAETLDQEYEEVEEEVVAEFG